MSDWTDVAALDELWDGAGIEVDAGVHRLALFRVGEAVFATDPMCTHGEAHLCEGFVEIGRAHV